MGDPVRIDYSAVVRWSKKLDPQEDAVEVAQLLGVSPDEAASMSAEQIADALGDLDDNVLTPLGRSAFSTEADLDETTLRVDNVAYDFETL